MGRRLEERITTQIDGRCGCGTAEGGGSGWMEQLIARIRCCFRPLPFPSHLCFRPHLSIGVLQGSVVGYRRAISCACTAASRFLHVPNVPRLFSCRALPNFAPAASAADEAMPFWREATPYVVKSWWTGRRSSKTTWTPSRQLSDAIRTMIEVWVISYWHCKLLLIVESDVYYSFFNECLI
jgi:hypothetical protein